MTTEVGRDRTIASWLQSIAPERAPAHVLAASKVRILGTAQDRGWMAGLRPPTIGRAAAVVAAVGVVALVTVGIARWSSPGIGGSGGSPGPTAAALTASPAASLGPTRAAYVKEVESICASASSQIRRDVGWMVAYDQVGPGPGDVRVVSFDNALEIAKATIRRMDDSLARLRSLAVPPGDEAQVDAAYALLEPVIDVLRRMPAAALANDEARLAGLIGERIEATHLKDQLVSSLGWRELGRALEGCPAAIGA